MRNGGIEMRKKIFKCLTITMLFVLMAVPVTVSAEEIDGETEYISMEEDPELTVEIVDEVLMPVYTTTYALNWTVGDKVFKQTKEFSKTSGSTVSIYAKIAPTTKNVTIGIKNSGGPKQYVKATGTVNKSFKITKTGKYRVFVENKSGKSITVKGNYRR